MRQVSDARGFGGYFQTNFGCGHKSSSAHPAHRRGGPTQSCVFQHRCDSLIWSRALQHDAPAAAGVHDTANFQRGVIHAISSSLHQGPDPVRLDRRYRAADGASAADTIKVGILHSLSGTMAISETALKNVALMTIEEINAKGGVMGKMLEPVVVDPASNWPLFAEKARQLISQDKVAVTFGCWTSVSRKSC